MSGLFNRLKSRKTGSNNHTNTNTNNESEPTAPAFSFDEQGFLCPICHHKFNDQTELAEHYIKTHAQEPVIENDNKNGVQNLTKQEITEEDSNPEVTIWKQQFIASEQTRMILSTELIQQKQRTDDLEEELQLLQKHLKSTQEQVADQSQEIANLKTTKDSYDEQLAIFTTELLKTQEELKEKQNQVATLTNDLIPRSTNDDVDVLKRELVSVQQCMNEMSLEKEQQIEKLRLILTEKFAECFQSAQKLDQLENIFNQNVLTYDELISKNSSEIQSGINQIKQLVRSTRERTEKITNVMKYMRNSLTENQTEIQQLKQTNTQLQNDLEQQKQSNDKLTYDLQIEQRQTNSYRNQIETLNTEIHTLEKLLNELKEEKNQLIQTKMDGDQDNERQNLVRQITQEKDQYEQQTKDLRIQIKQINNERQEIQDQFDNISKQFLQITNEKNQLQNEHIRVNNEIDSLRKQLDEYNKDKERRINEFEHELSTIREQYTSTENNLRKANEYNDNQKREIERLKTDFTEQINRLEQEKKELKQTINQQEQLRNETKIQLNIIEKEKHDIEQQLQIKQEVIEKLQITLPQLHDKLDEKENYIKRLSTGIRRSIDLAHKTREYCQQTVSTSQMNLLTTIEQAEQESRLIRAQTLEQIQEEFTHYLTMYQTISTDSKIKLEKQIEIDNLKLIEQQQQSEKQLNKIKHEHDKLIKEHHEQKQKFEIQLGELNRNLLQVSESLSKATQTSDIQREKYAQQITSLENELESQTKKHEMKLSALTENLATVRAELRTTHGKLTNLENIKTEKADIEARLGVSQEERRVLLERSLASESKNEKLVSENGQLTKKNNDLEAALQELAREYQSLQLQKIKVSQRRWLSDDDVSGCLKCNQSFSVTQRKHHCRSCGNIFCDNCSSKTAIVSASKKPQRVCDQCYKDLTT